jgi:hypothetical protein
MYWLRYGGKPGKKVSLSLSDDATPSKCRSLLKSLGLTVKQTLVFVSNAFFVSAPEGTGLGVFAVANSLLKEDLVELCHPELIREVRRRAAFPQQWHLKKATIAGHFVEHTYIGNLVVELIPPPASGVGSIVLHNREGGSARNISRTYDALNTHALASLIGKSPQGTWTLRVQDKARHDVGKIERFSVELEF